MLRLLATLAPKSVIGIARKPFSKVGGIPFELSISLPTDTIDSGQVVVSATITYYMGFEESTQKEPAQTQIFNFVRVYLREKSQWVVASHYAEIDFTERAQDAQNEQS